MLDNGYIPFIFQAVSWLAEKILDSPVNTCMRKKWPFIVLLVLIGAYFLGPHPSTPVYKSTLPLVPPAAGLDNYLKISESFHKIKPDNEARIVWNNDSLKRKTEYAIVYLPGFTASQAEGDPIHRQIARKFGCNLFLARLAEHGIDTTEALVNLTAENYWESAEEALAIGKQLGKQVILMGTSTGGTLALMLAARFPEVNSLVLLSPNIAINDPFAFLLNNPWGLQIAHGVLQSDYIMAKDQRKVYRQYWSTPYRVEAAVELQELMETSMTSETFKQVKQPVLTLYYYKDEVHQDSVVKVSAMKTMMEQLGTPESLKRALAIPGAGHHVIASYIKSKDLGSVQREIENFMRDVLNIKPVDELPSNSF